MNFLMHIHLGFWDLIISVIVVGTLFSCEDFLQVEPPKSNISKRDVFSDDVTAQSAINGLYVDMLSVEAFAGGDSRCVGVLAGLSADELIFHPTFSFLETYREFNENRLTSENSIVFDIWKSMYLTIYEANAIIEGLDQSKGVSIDAKRQLTGEALFIRAFTHFYLVNLFGDVPLLTSTDYEFNARTSRASSIDVYSQIIADLKMAQEMLNGQYVAGERIRPNKGAADAMLARVYLYMGNWSDAENAATQVINNTPLYALEDNLNDVFLSTSREAIWQLKPNVSTRNTNEGTFFILFFSPVFVTATPTSLTKELVNSFDAEDERFLNWINSYTFGADTYYYPFKYKKRTGPASSTPSPLTEYSMVLRLAEQYLIRSEARAQKGDLPGAISDIDVIRERAGLRSIHDINPTIDQTDLLQAIQNERRAELFTEWGHRWLDLKRTTTADLVLSETKNNWNSSDVLYPIPQSEFNKNPELGDQNDGY